jgi:hypothetical protein
MHAACSALLTTGWALSFGACMRRNDVNYRVGTFVRVPENQAAKSLSGWRCRDKNPSQDLPFALNKREGVRSDLLHFLPALG